jgi:KpsF/GutQ family protein
MDRFQIRGKVWDVWEQEAVSIRILKDKVDTGVITRIVDIIANCKKNNGRVITAGVGTSAAAAKKIAHTFSCIEIPSFFLSPGDSVHGALGSVQKGDVVIAVSKGGGTREVLNMLPAVKSKKAVLIGVTENMDSELAKTSDIVLKIEVEREPDPFNMLATASTMVIIAVFDAISIVLMETTGYKKEQFALIHPGGAVGERLAKKEKV